MPAVYRCRVCPVEVVAGWYHYHNVSSGYVAATLGYCKNCCAQYKVQIALRDQAPSEFRYVDCVLVAVDPGRRPDVMRRIRKDLGIRTAAAKKVIDQLPFTVRANVREWEFEEIKTGYLSAGGSIEARLNHVEQNPDVAPLQQDRLLILNAPKYDESAEQQWTEVPILGERAGLCGEFATSAQMCVKCNGIGTISTDMQEPPLKCPLCKLESFVYVRGWVT